MDPTIVLFLIKVIDGIALAVQHAPALVDRFREELGPLKTMIAENRPPTRIELESLDRKTAALSGRLQAIADADAL